MSEALTQVGAGGGVVVLETRVGRGKRSGGSQSRGPDRLRQVVAAGPGTLIPPLGASSPGLGAPIPEPAPFPASHPFWFPRRHPEVVVQRRVWPTSALSRPIARGRGSTCRGLFVLHEGPTYLEYPRPSSSRSPPSCSGRWRHQITASNGNQDWSTRRTSGLGSKGAPPGAAAGGILRGGGHFRVAGGR